MEECPYLLKVEEITETCVGAEGKRWYQVRWKSAWISDDVISPKIFQKTQNGKVHISGNNMIYEILDEKQTQDGRVEFLLSCKDSWESEENLKRAFNLAITIYWTSKTKAEELIKIEETSDDEGVTCCAVRSKRKSSEKVVNLIPSKSPIKDERDVGGSKSCAEIFLPTLSSDVDIPMQHLNLSTANVQSFESNIPDIKPKYDGILLTTSSISSSNSYSLNTDTSTNNNVKPEKGINVTSCSQQSFDLAAGNNEKPLSPSMYPIENSCLADPCDLPADRFSPKILKVEDSFPNDCEELTTSKDNCLIPELVAAYPSILNTSSDSTTIVPSDIDKSTLLDNHSEFLSYTSSVKVPSEIIKIEDSDEPDSCIHHSLSTGSKRMPFSSPIQSNSESVIGKNNENVPSSFAQITCKVECDDYPDHHQQSSILPPYPLASDNCTNLPNLPNLINVSAHLPTSENIPHGACKSENKYESSCQQDIKPPKLLPDSNRPELSVTGSCCCSVPDKPPLLIRNDAVQHMHRFTQNIGTDKRLVHNNKMLSNMSNINDIRCPPILNNNNNQSYDIRGKQFPDFNSLYQHRMSHGNESMIPPNFQQNQPPHPNDIQSIQQHNGSRVDHQISTPNFPKCNICGKQFPNYVALREHRATHHLNSQANMPVPNSHFQNDEFMYNEANPYMSRNPHRLGINPSSAPNDFPNTMLLIRNDAVQHMHRFPHNFGTDKRLVHNNKMLPNMSNINDNRRPPILNNNNNQSYDIRGKQFSDFNSLYQHRMSHVNDSMIPPNFQQNQPPHPNDIQSIQQHNGARVDHQISPPNFPKCNICGKQFPNYVALREHRATHHLNNQAKGMRVQIKEEVDTDFIPVPPVPNSHFQNDKFMYNEANPYISRNPHRLGINSSSAPNDFPNTMVCKQEGQMNIPNPQIPLAPHVVNTSGVFNIHQNDNISRQQHGKFIANPEVSINSNSVMSDANKIVTLQNPYMLPNGHIIQSSNYPTSNCKTEDSNNIIPMQSGPKDGLNPTSIQNSNSTASVEKTHKCDTCGETYTDYSKLKEHRKTHASEKQFSCELCDKTFTQNSTLKRHQRTHTREKPYKCEICGKSFSHNYNLKEHGKTHTGEKPYRCDICGKTFAQNYHLKEHQTTHSDAKPFKCDKCNKQFSLDSYLKKHQKIHTGEKPYKCDVCDKQFLQNSHLKDHRRIHTGEKPFKCEICAIRFSQNYTLKIHQRTHTGEKPYKCEICEKRFSQNSHLKEHRTRTHSGDKPFKCDQCHKEFSLDSYLKKHQKIHSGEKPFKCDICEKQFSQNYHLKEHRRIHTGEKPYKCQICEMRFSQNCSLKIHQRIHTGEKPYECEICGKQFSHSSNVKTHKRVHLTEKVKANVNPTVVSISYPPPVDSKVNILPSIPEIPQPVIATS